MNYSKYTVLKPLSYGYCLVKRHGDVPAFEIWLDAKSINNFVASFNFNDMVNFLLKSSHCADHKEAVKLLNKGGRDDR